MTVRMDRHGNVKPVRAQGRKSRPRWIDREVDRYRAGLLTLEGLGEAVLSELGWKYDESQPRVPAGSPEGGRWTSTMLSGGYTADIGGMDLARAHEQTIYKMAGSTDQDMRERAVVIGEGGAESEMIRGSQSSVAIPNPERGQQGTIHTHPGKYPVPTGPSPDDVEAHVFHAWESGNDNYTTVVVALDSRSPRLKVVTIKGWARGEPKRFADDLYRAVVDEVAGGLIPKIEMPYEEFIPGCQARIRHYATTVLGLEWEEDWLG